MFSLFLLGIASPLILIVALIVYAAVKKKGVAKPRPAQPPNYWRSF